MVLTPQQFRQIAPKLPGHVNMIAMTSAFLGLRVSEALGLRWSIRLNMRQLRFAAALYRGGFR